MCSTISKVNQRDTQVLCDIGRVQNMPIIHRFKLNL